MPSRKDDVKQPSDDELKDAFLQLVEPVQLSEAEIDEVGEIVRKARERFQRGGTDAVGQTGTKPIPTPE